MTIRGHFIEGMTWFILKCGSAPQSVSDNLNILMAMPVLFLLFVFEVFLLVLTQNHHLTTREIIVGTASGILSLGISSLAPNWRFVVCVAAAFLTLRSAFGIFVAPSPMVIALGVVNLLVAVGLYKWQLSADGPEKSG